MHIHLHPQFSAILLMLALCCGFLNAQEHHVNGQASGWISYASHNGGGGMRYLPEYVLEIPVDENLFFELSTAAHAFTRSAFSDNRSPLHIGSVKAYRLYGRLSWEQAEIRIGLQKINFGSASLFRPLMWFDALDPRDPLQLTDGVTGILGRYYFHDNSNLWLWGLYGNEERKGWEPSPTEPRSVEYGGRVQTPVFNGEIGATYHHRTADLRPLVPAHLPAAEHRYAVDGKWDAGIGIWFEGVFIQRASTVPLLHYQRQWTLGADYTFETGNGITLLTEFFRTDNPSSVFGKSAGEEFAAAMLSTPLSLLDRVSCILYHDRTRNEWYRFVSLQRTYDSWIVYLMGFWNPAAALNSSSFAGTGAQVMLVFNH